MNNLNTYFISNSFKAHKNKIKNPPSIFTRIKLKINNLLNTISAPILAAKEPKLWLSFDQQGNSYWNGYDPQSNRYARNLSEAEMRVWLEERY